MIRGGSRCEGIKLDDQMIMFKNCYENVTSYCFDERLRC
jgi:hypothetical protein